MSRVIKSEPVVVRAPAMKKKKQTIATRRPSRAQNAVPGIHGSESSTAKFYMFTYKIGNGRRALTMKNGVYNYGIEECPKSFNGSGRCKRGSKCAFAHSWVEVLFHPLFYKTKVCSKRSKCTQGAERCAFAHSEEDFRILRKILGADWRARDPVGEEKTTAKRSGGRKKKVTAEKERKKGENSRVADGMSVTSESWSCGRSVATGSSMATWSPSVAETCSSMSVSAPPEVAEEKETEMENLAADDAEIVGGDGSEDEPMEEGPTEFAWWFGNMLDAGQCMGEVLGRFEANGLDDLEFLWDLYRDDRRVFADAVTKVVGMEDEAARELLEQALCEYMNPIDVGQWLVRVVGLGQYVDVFAKFGSVDALVAMSLDDDALAEMGISSAGHRIKMLFHLRRAHEKMVGGQK